MSGELQLSQRALRGGDQPINYLMEAALLRPELISLAAGFVAPEGLPADIVQEAVAAILSEPARAQAALQYGSTPGLPALRQAVLEQFLQQDGRLTSARSPTADQVAVTAGSNQFLHLVSDVLFEPGDIVLTTAPTYFVYLGLLKMLGVRAVGVVCDEQGLIPEALEETLRRLKGAGDLPRVRAIYVVSYFDNPRGISVSAPRRPQLVEIAKRWSQRQPIYILEDAAYRELRLEGDDLPSLYSFDDDRQTVIHAQTFSKSLSPGLRVGWGLLPRPLVAAFLDMKGHADFGSPNFSQHIVAEVLERGRLPGHLRSLRATYVLKRATMLAAANEHLAPIPGARWIYPPGGLYVWAEMPPGVATGPASPLWAYALAEGILYVPGEYCYPAEGAAASDRSMRLSFGVQTCDQITSGIAILARAVRAVLAGEAPRAKPGGAGAI